MSESISPLVVIAKIRAKKDAAPVLRRAYADLVNSCEGEDGLLFYSVHHDLTDPCVFFFYERWATKIALEEHLKSANLTGFTKAFGEYMDGKPELSFMELLEETPKSR